MYTFFNWNVLETQKTRVKPTFIFSNLAKPNSKFLKTQLNQLNAAYNFSKPS